MTTGEGDRYGVEAVTVADVKVGQNGTTSVSPYLILETRGEELTAPAPGYVGRSLVDIGRQAHGSDARQSVFDWGTGTADSLKAAYESSDLDVDSVEIRPDRQRGGVSEIETGTGRFQADMGSGLLTAVLSGAGLYMHEDMGEQLTDPRDLGVEPGSLPMLDPDQSGYSPREADAPEDLVEWDFCGRVQGELDLPSGVPRAEYGSTMISPGSRVNANVIGSDGEMKALYFDPVELTRHSFNRFKFDADQNTYHLDSPEEPGILGVPEIEHHLLAHADDETGYSAEVNEKGWVYTEEILQGEDELDERSPDWVHPMKVLEGTEDGGKPEKIALVEPDKAYRWIDDSSYEIPANLQNVLPALVSSVKLSGASSTKEYDPTFR